MYKIYRIFFFPHGVRFSSLVLWIRIDYRVLRKRVLLGFLKGFVVKALSFLKEL